MLDLNNMTLHATNAGHPQPWLLRKGDAVAVGAHGLMLGILPDTAYGTTRVPLKPGDCLVFFTDGVSEAMSCTRDLFRPQGVLKALKSTPWRTAEQAADVVWSALQQHQAVKRGKDDQTLLVIRLPER
jgi:sigma-B regulation protein RsbU (phosphoserine phosphatase)